MMVKVYYTELPTILTTRNFSILVTSPCLYDVLTIDATKFPSPALTYKIRLPTDVFKWTDSAVTSVVNLPTICGPYSWKVTKRDEVTPIDSTIFT